MQANEINSIIPSKRREVVIDFLDGVGAAGDGEWINTKGMESLNVYVNGIGTATVEVDGFTPNIDSSGDVESAPANSSHGSLIDSVTADGFFVLRKHELPMYVKVRVSNWTGGTINAVGLAVYC